MTAEVYAEWLRRQGQSVIRSTSSWWHSEGWGVYQAFPYHRLIGPKKSELRDLMKRALASRYSMAAPTADSQSGNGYHVVYSSAAYGLENLSARPRKNVRRALRGCQVEPISFERYLHEGWRLRADTLNRQQRELGETKERWQRRFQAASDLPGFEIWGAQVEGNLAATLMVFHMDDWYYLISQQSDRKYLPAMVNNALTFTVTQQLCQRGETRGIFYGMSSLDAAGGVDEFKLHMGYEQRPVTQRIVFHAMVAPAVNRISYAMMKTVAALKPRSRWLGKAAGMLRLACVAENPAPALAQACETGKESC